MTRPEGFRRRCQLRGAAAANAVRYGTLSPLLLREVRGATKQSGIATHQETCHWEDEPSAAYEPERALTSSAMATRWPPFTPVLE